MYACMYLFIINVHIHESRYARVCVCMYVRKMHICMYIHIYMYIRMYVGIYRS